MSSSLTPTEWADYYHKEMSIAFEKLQEAKKKKKIDDVKKYKEDMYFNRDLMLKWGKKARAEKLKNRQNGIYTLDTEMEKIIYDEYISEIHKNTNVKSLQKLKENYSNIKNKWAKKATKSYVEMRKTEACQFSKKGDCYRILSFLCLDKIKNLQNYDEKREETPEKNEKELKLYLSMKCSLIPKKYEEDDYSEIRKLHKLLGDVKDSKKERKKDKLYDDEKNKNKIRSKEKNQEKQKKDSNSKENLSDSEIFRPKQKISSDSDDDNRKTKKKEKNGKEIDFDEEYQRELKKEDAKKKEKENIKKNRENDECIEKRKNNDFPEEKNKKHELFIKNGKQKIFDVNQFNNKPETKKEKKEKDTDFQYSFNINTDVFDNFQKNKGKTNTKINEEERKEKDKKEDKYHYISLEGQNSKSIKSYLNQAIKDCKNNEKKKLIIHLYKKKKTEDYEDLKESVIYFAKYKNIDYQLLDDKIFLFNLKI